MINNNNAAVLGWPAGAEFVQDLFSQESWQQD